MARRKSWTEKLRGAAPAAVKPLAKAFAGIPAGAPLLVPDGPMVRDFIAAIPRGETRSAPALRADMAAARQAAATCPVTTGILVRIVAEAALEQLAAGASPGEITPFWRLVGPDDPAATRISCGPAFIAEMREREQRA